MSDRDRITTESTPFERLCEIIHSQNVSEWQGGIHPEDVGHLARALIEAGCRLPETPCGAQVLILGIEYVCDREQHTEPVHECTDDVGVMQWRDSDDGPVVVAAWVHDGSDGWEVR